MTGASLTKAGSVPPWDLEVGFETSASPVYLPHVVGMNGL